MGGSGFPGKCLSGSQSLLRPESCHQPWTGFRNPTCQTMRGYRAQGAPERTGPGVSALEGREQTSLRGLVSNSCHHMGKAHEGLASFGFWTVGSCRQSGILANQHPLRTLLSLMGTVCLGPYQNAWVCEAHICSQISTHGLMGTRHPILESGGCRQIGRTKISLLPG